MEDNDLADLLKDYIESKRDLSALQKVSYRGYVTITKDDFKSVYESLDYSVKQIIIHCIENYEIDYHGGLRKK